MSKYAIDWIARTRLFIDDCVDGGDGQTGLGEAVRIMELLVTDFEAHNKEITRLKTEWGIWHDPEMGETFVCQVPAQAATDASEEVLDAWVEQCDDFPEPDDGDLVAIVTARDVAGDDQVGPYMELTFVRWQTAGHAASVGE